MKYNAAKARFEQELLGNSYPQAAPARRALKGEV